MNYIFYIDFIITVLIIAIIILFLIQSSWLQRKIVYSNWTRRRFNHSPLDFNFNKYKYFMLNNSISMWYLYTNPNNNSIMYCHGNTGTLSSSRNILFYKLILSLHINIYTFDYRGYGQSTDVKITKKTLIEDVLVVYNYILSHKSKNTKLYGYGFSLGSAILATVSNQLYNIAGFIYEAPFSSMQDVVNYKFTKFIKLHEDVSYNNELSLRTCNKPKLILASTNDNVIDISLTYKLVDSLINYSFVKVDKSSHINIFNNNEVVIKLREFLNKN